MYVSELEVNIRFKETELRDIFSCMLNYLKSTEQHYLRFDVYSFDKNEAPKLDMLRKIAGLVGSTEYLNEEISKLREAIENETTITENTK